jgi:hypothetical protein
MVSAKKSAGVLTACVVTARSHGDCGEDCEQPANTPFAESAAAARREHTGSSSVLPKVDIATAQERWERGNGQAGV